MAGVNNVRISISEYQLATYDHPRSDKTVFITMHSIFMVFKSFKHR